MGKKGTLLIVIVFLVKMTIDFVSSPSLLPFFLSVAFGIAGSCWYFKEAARTDVKGLPRHGIKTIPTQCTMHKNALGDLFREKGK